MRIPPIYRGGRAGTATRYKGKLFRSNLESRWAEFFDEESIDWCYEKYTFDLEGAFYTPDFYLPTQKVFVEVKPDIETLRHEGMPRMELLCARTKMQVVAGVGVPNTRDSHLFADPTLPPGKRLSRHMSMYFKDGAAALCQQPATVFETRPITYLLDEFFHEPSLT